MAEHRPASVAGDWGIEIEFLLGESTHAMTLKQEGETVSGHYRFGFSSADVVGAITSLMDCPRAVGEVINVGTDRGITINELAEKVIAMTGSKSTTRHVSYEEAYGRPFDDMLVRKPCLDKVKGLIGYEPRFSLADTLNQIIEHERARPGG